MSGTSKVLPPLADQPIAGTGDGRPSYIMTQWMQRVSQEVSPASGASGGSGGGPTTLYEQVQNLTTTVAQALTIQGFADPSLPAQVAALRDVVGWLQAAIDTPPAVPPPAAFVPRDTGILHLLNGGRVLDGYGVPNGAVFGNVGDEYLQLDGTAIGGPAWFKNSGNDTDTGWLQAGSGSSGTAIYAPLVNGDLPGPTLIADPFGQCVMVEIR